MTKSSLRHLYTVLYTDGVSGGFVTFLCFSLDRYFWPGSEVHLSAASGSVCVCVWWVYLENFTYLNTQLIGSVCVGTFLNCPMSHTRVHGVIRGTQWLLVFYCLLWSFNVTEINLNDTEVKHVKLRECLSSSGSQLLCSVMLNLWFSLRTFVKCDRFQ